MTEPLIAEPVDATHIPASLFEGRVSPRGRLAKAAWTWLTPIGLAAGSWDAIVSTLRIYSERELRDLVAPFGQGYEWTYGTYDYPFGGRGCYFQGLP